MCLLSRARDLEPKLRNTTRPPTKMLSNDLPMQGFCQLSNERSLELAEETLRKRRNPIEPYGLEITAQV